MQCRISRVLLWSIVAVLAADSASAEEKTTFFSNPFSISSGIENTPIQGGYATESVTLLTPSRFSYNRASSRTHWGVGYQPEFEFRAGSGQNTWNHSADATFGHLFSRRTKLDFGHSFVKSSDPARIFTESIFVMPRDGFLGNATAVTLSHEHAARTTLNLRFDNSITKMSAGEGVGATILNQSGMAGTVGISEQLSPRHKVTLSYSLLKFRPYRFDSALDTGQFAANIPTMKAGIALFGAALAAAVSRSSPSPAGIASVSQPSNSSQTPPVHSTTSVSAAGQNAEVPAAPSTSTATSGGTARAASVPAPAPAPAPATVVVPPPTVPLVPSVTAPSINPTLPLVGVVTPVPAASSSSAACAGLSSSKQKDCEKKAAEAAKKAAEAAAKAGSATNTKAATAPANSTTSTSTASPTAAAPTTASLTSNSAGASQNLQMFENPFHVLSATYTFAHGPGLLIELSGGAMHDRDISYLMGVQVIRRVDRLWFSGGFQRFLSYYGTTPFQGAQPTGSITLPTGQTASSVFSAWTGSVGGKLNRRTDLETSISLSNSNANFVVHDMRSTIGRARVSYWLNDKLSFFVDFETFHENRNEFEVTHFNRQRYFGGLQVRLSPPASGPAQVAGK